MDKLNEKPLAPEARRILEALCDHPLLSRRQLELYLGRSGRTTREFLRDLRQRGLVQQVNAHEPRLTARSLQMPTQAAIAILAQGVQSPITAYSRQRGLNQARLDQLISLTERVFQVRTVLLWLQRPKGKWNWKPKVWDVEVEKRFYAGGKSFSIPFHGAALFERNPEKSEAESKDGQWAFGVIEFDIGRAPVYKDRERLAHFVLAQDDRRFWQKFSERTFPTLIVIAQDEFRLQDYYSILRSVALARGLPMPRAYLTTAREAVKARNDVTQPIWYSTISGRRTLLLFDTDGVALSMPSEIPWQRIEMAKSSTTTPAVAIPSLSQANPTNHSKQGDKESRNSKGTGSFANLVFTLKPVDKLVLDEIASHPLLTAEETASLMRLARWRVQATLRRLTELKLVEPYSPPDTSAHKFPRQRAKDSSYRYLPAKDGLAYLAMIAGFGTKVKRYAYARGWANGFEGLVRHWEHTRAENEFFLKLARIARERKHWLDWLSELESRMYYSAGKRWHSFLPDGRGTYKAKSVRYEFALEIDRSRSSQSKFRRKLNE
ncbi:MAG: replication-relaxation family protein [Chloroflexi bacterium]|nr:replication-relaxation family protein [Chloroflexota bacterium]